MRTRALNTDPHGGMVITEPVPVFLQMRKLPLGKWSDQPSLVTISQLNILLEQSSSESKKNEALRGGVLSKSRHLR